MHTQHAKVLNNLKQKIKIYQEYKYHLARNDFYEFTKLIAKHINQDYNLNQKWVKILCYNIQDFLQSKDVNRFILNAPPRLGKTTFATLLTSAFIIGIAPKSKIAIFSSSLATVDELGFKFNDIVNSDIYKSIFKTRIKSTLRRKKIIDGGEVEFRISGGNLKGKGYNFIFFDDFLNAKDLTTANHDRAKRQLADLTTRTEYTPVTKIFVQEQRLFIDDTTAILTSGWKPNNIPYKHIIFQYQFKEQKVFDVPIINERFVFEENEFVDLKFSDEDRKRIIADKGAFGDSIFETQYQQNPTPDDSYIFKKEHIQDISMTDVEILKQTNKDYIKRIISIDAAISEKKTADYTAIVCFIYDMLKGIYYVVDVFRKKVVLDDLQDYVAGICDVFKPDIAIIENKANGQPLITSLRRGNVISKSTGKPLILSILEVNPTTDKRTRCVASVFALQAKRVFIAKADSSGAVPWRYDFENELLNFPNGQHDDQVDAFAQAIDKMSKYSNMAGGDDAFVG